MTQIGHVSPWLAQGFRVGPKLKLMMIRIHHRVGLVVENEILADKIYNSRYRQFVMRKGHSLLVVGGQAANPGKCCICVEVFRKFYRFGEKNIFSTTGKW